MNSNAKSIDEKIAKIRHELDYQRFLTPINYKEENSKFLEFYKSGERYNPQYRYERFDSADVKRILDSIDKTKLGDAECDEMLIAALEDLETEIALYSALGNDEVFPRLSVMLNGEPNRLYEGIASEILTSDTASTDSMSVSAYELADMIKERLIHYGFSWRVELRSKMASRISVEPDETAIYINEPRFFTARDAERLLVHEVDTHVLRAENGAKRELKLYSSGTPGSLPHEEGLALYNEQISGVADGGILKLYAARFLCCINISLSFWDLFCMLIDLGCDENMAMYVVPRIKRGLADTSRPGGFIKDYVYLQGLQEITLTLEEHPWLYDYLYYGSISIDDAFAMKAEIERTLKSGEVILPIFRTL